MKPLTIALHLPHSLQRRLASTGRSRLMRRLTRSMLAALSGTGLPLAAPASAAPAAHPALSAAQPNYHRTPAWSSSAAPSSEIDIKANVPVSLTAALDFNIFVLGDLAQSQTETKGRLAAGGNVTLDHYRVGDGLPNSRSKRDDLIVGGSLTFNDGVVAKGNIVIGKVAQLNRVDLPGGRLRSQRLFDFTKQAIGLAQVADRFSRLPTNASTIVKTRNDAKKEITLSGTDRQLNVFRLSSRDLAAALILKISVPFGSTVLVNIDGLSNQMQNLGFTIADTDRQHVLYNFYEATELILTDNRIQGSILAPHAHVNFATGRINGTLIGATLTGAGIAGYFPFIGDLVTPGERWWNETSRAGGNPGAR